MLTSTLSFLQVFRRDLPLRLSDVFRVRSGAEGFDAHPSEGVVCALLVRTGRFLDGHGKSLHWDSTKWG